MERYYVSVTQAAGMIGSMTVEEIQEGLANGNLKPTFVCLPTEPVGDPNRKWLPLGVIFPSPEAENTISEEHTDKLNNPTVWKSAAHEERLASLERRVAALSIAPEPSDWISSVLLSFGQIISILGCMAAMIYPYGYMSYTAVLKKKVPNTPDYTIWIICAAVAGFLYSAAMFVVFSRCKYIQGPREMT